MIEIACSCGTKLRAKDEAAGKAVRCPKCGSAVRISTTAASTKADPEGQPNVKSSDTRQSGSDTPERLASNGEANATAAADLRRRLGQTSKLRAFFLLLLPLGAIIPFTIAYFIAPEGRQSGFTAAQGFAIAGIGLPLIGLCGLLLMWNDHRKIKRSVNVADAAKTLGLKFLEKADESLMSKLKSFRLFSDADNYFGDNVCLGDFSARKVALLEFATAYKGGSPGQLTLSRGAQTLFKQYSTALAKGTSPVYGTLNNQTVVIVFDVRKVPDFRIGPKGWIDHMAEACRSKTIPYPKNDEFNRNFSIWTEEAEQVLRCLTPKAADLVLGTQNATVEVFKGCLVIYRHRELNNVREYEQSIRTAVELARALETP